MTTRFRTQVAIVGAGPAGLVLAQLLHLERIDSVVIENCSRQHVEERVRAGVLEQNTVDLLKRIGNSGRMEREGLIHQGIELRFAGRSERIDFRKLTGKAIMIYPQNKVLNDLTEARLGSGRPIHFEASNVSIDNFDEARPVVRYRKDGLDHEIACDFIAGCDGFHGICRPSISARSLTEYERAYPFGWLGILAEAPPASEELIYALHERGFALLSMRSPTISRLYLQCKPDEDVAGWPDEKIWHELEARTSVPGWKIARGPVLQKGVTGMRSFVVEPMQYGNLFLAGDSAHIVPPTGAKGLNLAVADVQVLARGLADFYRGGTRDQLNRYSEICLRRVWKVQRFSWWMTSMLHRFPDANPFDYRRQIAELDYVTSSEAAAKSLAENYVGLPLEPATP
jgi:p-hydroxybenzoate 3-monooxygenase